MNMCLCAHCMHAPQPYKTHLCQLLGSSLSAMFQRASQPSSSSNALPEQDFEEDVEDLVADNLVSGERAARLLNKAAKAGLKGVGKCVGKLGGRNHARAIRRHKLMRTKWPDYYFFDCRVQDRRSTREYVTALPINLPLDILEVIWELGLPEVLLSTDNLDTAGKKHLAWMKEQLQVEELWGWGMHGDGIPCNYDRTESVIMISLNLPGLRGKNGRMRIPLFVLPDHAVSENTFDDVMEVIAWSMRHLVAGARPCCRHDGTPWGKGDGKRQRKNESPLKFRACMVQARADWDWMGKCFHFPFHNVKEGCCWLCRCKRNQVSIFMTPPPITEISGPLDQQRTCASGCTHCKTMPWAHGLQQPITQHGLGSPSHKTFQYKIFPGL